MLVAQNDGVRCEAVDAQRGLEYRCPECSVLLTLKRGRIVVPHFAHKPPIDCDWASYETRQHLEAKRLVKDALTARGIRAEVEFVVDAISGDRRADVMTWSSKGLPVAIELQHTSIGLSDIERRSFSYAAQGIAQIWIPFVHLNSLPHKKRVADGLLISKYSLRPYAEWIYGLYGNHGMWMYDPDSRAFWLSRISGHQLYKEETTYYSQDGDEVTSGGYFYWSKRFRDLAISGPFKFETLRIKTAQRQAERTKIYRWPAGRLAYLALASET